MKKEEVIYWLKEEKTGGRKLEENLKVQKKKKKCMEVDIKEVISSVNELDGLGTKKMTFCVQS